MGLGSVSLESFRVCVRIDLLADGDPLERFARGRGVELDGRAVACELRARVSRVCHHLCWVQGLRLAFRV
jgi:hypothetical protein